MYTMQLIDIFMYYCIYIIYKKWYIYPVVAGYPYNNNIKY